MEPTATAKFAGRLLLRFVLLWLLRAIPAAPAGSGVDATRRGGEGALLLSYTISITSPVRPGQPWCDIQGWVNGNEFLSCPCGSKEVKPIGALGMKLNHTAFWEKQEEPLKYLAEELRKKLLDIKAETLTKSNSVTMQVTLMCECGTDGRHIRVSWRFRINGQLTHRFDPENTKWTVVPPGIQRFKGTLDSDRELTELLVKIANGDFRSWLPQVWEHWREMRETTGAPNTTLGVALIKGAAIRPIPSIFLALLMGSVFLVVHGTVL